MLISFRFDSLFSLLCGLLFSFSFYAYLLGFVLFVFLFTRVPYSFGLSGFGLFLLVWVFPLFLSHFFTRLFSSGVSAFFSSFVPYGTPLWISPLVVMAETVSYVVRPLVLLLRPFLNISIGSFGGVALGSFCLVSKSLLVVMVFLFFYEVFVAVVHWFIVCNILSFSKDH